MAKVKVKELKKGEWFTRKQVEFPTEKQVFVRGEYDRSEKKYECWKFEDVNDTFFMDGNKEVFTDFVF